MKNQLKQFLYDRYGGFADKRIKRIDRDASFRIDDAFDDVQDHVCHVFARVVDDEKIQLIFNNNPPSEAWVKAVARDSGGQVNIAQIIINVGYNDYALIEDIAVQVGCGEKPYYKWARDRVCSALRRFSENLRQFNNK